MRSEIETTTMFVARAERLKTIDEVDRAERALRLLRPFVQDKPDIKKEWSELCRRTAVVRDELVNAGTISK